MEKINKILFLIIGLVFMISLIGGYYAYGQYQQNKYYDSYKLQCYNAQKSGDAYSEAYNGINSSLTSYDSISQNYPDFIKKMDESKNYQNIRKSYINEMIKYSGSDFEKQYAQLLSKDADLSITYIDQFKEFITALKDKDDKKFYDLDAQLKITENATYKNNILREDIKSKNPKFAKLLNIQYNLAENAIKI